MLRRGDRVVVLREAGVRAALLGRFVRLATAVRRAKLGRECAHGCQRAGEGGDQVAATGQSGEWSGDAYAKHSGHHRAFDDWFLERHPPSGSDVVVDLGCGSGEFSAKVATLVPDGRVIGVDPDPSMLEQARAHDQPNLSFVEAAAADVDQVVLALGIGGVPTVPLTWWSAERCCTGCPCRGIRVASKRCTEYSSQEGGTTRNRPGRATCGRSARSSNCLRTPRSCSVRATPGGSPLGRATTPLHSGAADAIPAVTGSCRPDPQCPRRTEACGHRRPRGRG